jgi:hypothetical protein
MPIGNSKAGLFGGKALVPGGSATFTSPGTFTVPTGVTKVNITGVGQPGNSGNPGNSAPSPSRPGAGGGGGGGGTGDYRQFVYGCTSSGDAHHNQIGRHGGNGGGYQRTLPHAPGAPSGQGEQGTAHNWAPLGASCPGFSGGHYFGNPGQPGSPGPAGNPGNSGSAGATSSGLGYSFPGGAGGNGGHGGSGGSGGGGGEAGSPGGARYIVYCWGGQPVQGSGTNNGGGSAGSGGFPGGGNGQGQSGCPNRGGGGAGSCTNGGPGNACAWCTRSQGGGYVQGCHHRPTNYCPCNGTHDWGEHTQFIAKTGGDGGFRYSPANSVNPLCYNGSCETNRIRMWRSGGGGGGGGERETASGGAGAGGGGRGNGGQGSSPGNPGQPASPAPYTNVTVQPGGSYPISASSPGTVHITWDPQ